MHPPIISPKSNSINAQKSNIPISMPMWYIANSVELNKYATFRDVYFFKVIKPNPLKKNSSRKEFISEMYNETKIKFRAVMPMPSVKLEVTLEKSITFLVRKYPPTITAYTPNPSSNALRSPAFLKTNIFLKSWKTSLFFKKNSISKAKKKTILIGIFTK